MYFHRCQESVVEYLLTQLKKNFREKRIDAFELLGASFANDKDNYDIIKAFSYLEKGMAERWSNPYNEPILKPSETLIPSHRAYDNHVECASPEDLGIFFVMIYICVQYILEKLYTFVRNLFDKYSQLFVVTIFRGYSRISKQNSHGGLNDQRTYSWKIKS